MLLHKAYSTATSNLNWRTQINQIQMVSQISSILIQRHNWVSLLLNLNLSSKLTPFLFLQILYNTQSHPQISVNFFNWAVSNLKFKPDLISQCHVIQVSLRAGLTQSAKTILDSLVQAHSSEMLVETMVRACKGKSSQSDVLSFVLECYSRKGLFMEALEVYRKMKVIGCTPSVHACNTLLDVLQRGNKTKLAWCFYGSMLRIGILPDKFTCSLVAHTLRLDGKFERIVKLLDMGICNSVMYNSVVDYYGRIGDLEAAFCRINEMHNRKLDTSFSTYSSILDGACKCRKVEVIERVMSIMMEKGLLPKPLLSECGSTIQKLCHLGKVNAATMFFKKACDEKILLWDATYGCMLKAFSKQKRVEEAISLYRVIIEKGITIKNSAYHAFVDLLCEEEQLEDRYGILREIMRRGFSPCTSNLCKFISSLCAERKWQEVEELLNVILENGLLPDSLSCCSLVEHYCSIRQIDKVIALHGKLEKSGASLDLTTYNVVLDGLVKEGRIEDSIRVFDYMKGLKLVNSASFTVMIRALCRAKELRKAMKLHDEMLNMELKPDKATYKRLILEFKQ
ncbi:pentatricopeptide repeat-containing protein At4g21170 [Manihot esculenta]|uniref:Pentacotripeptide-repeat region of PRORP domain-containing protein n=1 Tax=Manihot esculenta TaxID=3983 RepID=A0A2C9U8N7_MANES|nr:pentatricopeptide repeat-containing protein At4g21170 [Manihot esculenta]OAY25976.1 hypothetical protein MANES_16G011600v8 [Manihot esculenta]